MNGIDRIHMNPSTILNVPLDLYDDDFTFIVNGKEYKTTRLISDLLSPVICKIHQNDPIFDEFRIKTEHEGDFSYILNLTKFIEIDLPKEELPFICEIVDILGNQHITLLKSTQNEEITNENAISLLQKHEKCQTVNLKQIEKEIDFISSHFFELCDENIDEFAKFSIETFSEILNNPKLQLKSEDQLLNFINELYKKDDKYSILYESVYFLFVSSEMMKTFLEIFDFNNLTSSIWILLSARLEREINVDISQTRYVAKTFLPTEENKNVFDGIINFLKIQLNDQIETEISLTASSYFNNNYLPINIFSFDDPNQFFCSQNIPNSWICIDFKKHRISPSHYKIRSFFKNENSGHLRNWVIECSNDNILWETVDERKDCQDLNGKNLVHTFKIKIRNFKEFRYIRIRSTGLDWKNENWLPINSFEIYGTFI